MNRRCLLVLMLACGSAVADAEQDLKFAQKLGVRGLKEMALKVLTDLENSSDPAAARAGRFGKAQLTKFEASIAKARFLRDLEEGIEPRVSREQVLALYADAAPKVEEYVKNRPENVDARFLLGELLQEYAEFLSGVEYPDSMADQRTALVKKHKDEVSKLFERAIDSYTKVVDQKKKEVPKDAAPGDPNYVRLTQAEFNRGLARFRWASIFPKGPNFQHRIDDAVEELDDFLQRHFQETAGAYAMIYLGRAFYEKALRLGDPGEGEIALNYFENVFQEVPEDPGVPATIAILGEAFYWYTKTANALALGSGNLKKAQKIFFQNTQKAGTLMSQKLKYGSKNPMAMRARLEVAEADAFQGNFDNAVSVAGDVLATARVEGQGGIVKLATSKLTSWVANVRGTGALDPALLFQIGASLSAQGRIGNAITFYEKAIAASTDEDTKEKYGYPAQLEIARTYRRDKRYLAGAAVAWDLVQEFLKSGADADSDFGLTASEACNQARVCWRAISDQTKASKDSDTYQRVLSTFREKFPGHPENSDAAYGTAIDEFTRGNYEEAAKLLRDINPSSRSYWRAQQRVPQCYRILAQKEKDEAKTKQWHTKCLESAKALVGLATGKEDEGAKRAVQYGRLYTAIALSSLQQWKESLEAIDGYLAQYPGKLLKRGMELKIKIDAHHELGQLKEAEAALAMLREKAPNSAYLKGEVVDVYTALRKAYKAMEPGDARKDMASRAADLWQEHMSSQDEAKLTETHYFALGDALKDAQRYKEAGEAFASAAGMVSDEARKAYFTLQAAEMAFEAAREGMKNKTIDRKEYLAIMKTTRERFTDVLIPEKADQPKVLTALKNYQKRPPKSIYDKIKRRPGVLLTTAKVYAESASGADGRWIAVRLIDYLHAFTLPVKDQTKPKLEEHIPTWWNGAELKLEIYKAISESGGESGRVAKTRGSAFAKKIIFQYQKMDGPERVKRVKALEEQLR